MRITIRSSLIDDRPSALGTLVMTTFDDRERAFEKQFVLAECPA
jgi:hypothetical protein